MPRLFISYSSEDSQFVDELVHKLKLRSVDVWYDKYEIKIGDSIVEKISDGIGASDWLLMCFSKASVKSKWVRQELNAAVALTVKRGAFILPVLIDAVEVPTILIDRKYADFVKDPNQAFKDILAVVAPGMANYNNENSQIAWGILSNIFRNMSKSDEGANPSKDIVSNLSSHFASFKDKWDMSDAVYNIYIESCLDAGRLLTLVEFIEKIPIMLDKNSEGKDEVVQFLLKKLKIGL